MLGQKDGTYRMLKELQHILESIDTLLDSYEPGELDPDRLVREVFAQRASQRPTLEKVVVIATEALEKYTFNSELVRRRAFAKTLIVTPDGEYPFLESADADYRLLLDLNPSDFFTTAELLEVIFTFSRLEDSEVAQIADDAASKAEKMLLNLRGLQIKALGYADQHSEAEQLYRAWSTRYPDAEVLESAIADARSMNPDVE